MIIYADPSFLFSFYVQDLHSPKVTKYLKSTPEIMIADLVEYEFMQAARLKMFHHSHQQKIGFSREKGALILEQFSRDLETGLFTSQHCNWQEVLPLAHKLSARHTREQGYRSFDLLHVAAALHLQAAEFLTFDQQQGRLAKAEGLALVF